MTTTAIITTAKMIQSIVDLAVAVVAAVVVVVVVAVVVFGVPRMEPIVVPKAPNVDAAIASQSFVVTSPAARAISKYDFSFERDERTSEPNALLNS